jgi:four helix bundle protein
MKIEKFTDLIAWQKSHTLVLSVYKITANFPKEEIYGLTNQLRRASVSISSCIAEGFSRGTNKDKTQFYRMSLGSLTEVQNQLMIARDLGYIESLAFDELSFLTVEIHKLINGLIKALRD